MLEQLGRMNDSVRLAERVAALERLVKPKAAVHALADRKRQAG